MGLQRVGHDWATFTSLHTKSCGTCVTWLLRSGLNTMGWIPWARRVPSKGTHQERARRWHTWDGGMGEPLTNRVTEAMVDCSSHRNGLAANKLAENCLVRLEGVYRWGRCGHIGRSLTTRRPFPRLLMLAQAPLIISAQMLLRVSNSKWPKN